MWLFVQKKVVYKLNYEPFVNVVFWPAVLFAQRLVWYTGLGLCTGAWFVLRDIFSGIHEALGVSVQDASAYRSGGAVIEVWV